MSELGRFHFLCVDNGTVNFVWAHFFLKPTQLDKWRSGVFHGTDLKKKNSLSNPFLKLITDLIPSVATSAKSGIIDAYFC